MRRRPLLATLLVSGAVALGCATRAAATAWRVDALAGSVKVRTASDAAAAWRTLEADARFREPIQVATERDGHVRLENGEVSVFFGPGALLELPDPRRQDASLRVVQRLGTARYDVSFRAPGTLEVETPALVARASGTTLTVSASPTGASVHATDGAAEVHPAAGGAAAVIGSGQTALRRSSAPLSKRGELVEPPPGEEAGVVSVSEESAHPGAGALATSAFLELGYSQGFLRPELPGTRE